MGSYAATANPPEADKLRTTTLFCLEFYAIYTNGLIRESRYELSVTRYALPFVINYPLLTLNP